MQIHTRDDLIRVKQEGERFLFTDTPRIIVGTATCGLASGAQAVLDAITDEVATRHLDVVVTETGCAGFCQKEPLVDIVIPGQTRITFDQVTPEKARALVAGLSNGGVPEALALGRTDAEELLVEDVTVPYRTDGLHPDLEAIPLCGELPFYHRQYKIAMRNCGVINPANIEEYIARGGYFALHEVLTQHAPEAVIEEIKQSGLKGRGGGGFLTGRKWESCRNAPGEPKYVICNADEGDPGAYMDRSILEGDPHSVLEGMIIGAYAIGSHEGYIYVRAEYPLAIRRLKTAIDQAQQCGLLGSNIFGTGFDFTIKINRGGGAFVCGESTALMASLEGRAGEPRAKYIHTVESGLWSKPSNLNNVETWANVPAIMMRGAAWYAGIGTPDSKGTKVFSLVGKINNTGLVEVPMGISLRDIIYEIGNGIPDGRRFKAVQTGGPSGGCIPESLIDTPVDYDRLWELGSMMGSGGMIVMDETTCMVDVAMYFIDFLRDESCGKCVPCREGLDALYDILVRITEGNGREGDIELLEEVSETVINGSLCGLGTSAPNPVLSTIRYFRDEYEAHIRFKRCPAAVCKQIVSSACQHICPLHTDVPAYLTLIATGKYLEAAQVIRKTNPLPSICGRVCHHPCQSRCAASQFGEAVPINDLKRFALDYERRQGNGSPQPPVTPKYEKVAVIGAGPAGLTAAHDLALMGYQVTIFEALPIAGGMLAVGIPQYRLPRSVLEYDIAKILALGVELKTNVRIGHDLTIDDLRAEDYQAVLLAVGMHQGKQLPIAGADLDGVLLGVPFLRDIALGTPVRVGKKTAIIGGGNVGIDCARSALREGAEEVHMVFLEPRDAMLAHPWDIEEALEEGIVFHPSQGPKAILGEEGGVRRVETIEEAVEEGIVFHASRGPKAILGGHGGVKHIEMMECLSVFDPDGSFNPSFKEGTETVLEVDTVIIAIGQTADVMFLEPVDGGVTRTDQGTVGVDPSTLATDAPGVFAAGDITTGPATVTDAMAGGREAAESIHRSLRGLPLERQYAVTRPAVRVEAPELSDEELQEIAGLGRRQPPRLPVGERARGYAEVRGCFGEDVAVSQAKRCLRCDLAVARES
ncbi:MAG: FAD-dependent oxidoreductase [Gemmatimonadales bacterium]|nr:FAD-dependent oxidoreductase [Gemmatimonadales bacterium]